jgi:hypothetical protein
MSNFASSNRKGDAKWKKSGRDSNSRVLTLRLSEA